MLPDSVGSLQGLEKCGAIAVASGGTTDIWRGVWNDNHVSLKAFRIYPLQDLREAKKILWKSVPVWKRLAHDNILPFHGVETSMFELALVYDWGYNGNIIQYLKSHPSASRPKLVTFLLHLIRILCPDHWLKLLQVAKALQYLHSLEILHGDLKGVSWTSTPDLTHTDDEFHLGQRRNIQNWNSPGLRLRSHPHHLQPNLYNRRNARSFSIPPMARPRAH